MLKTVAGKDWVLADSIDGLFGQQELPPEPADELPASSEPLSAGTKDKPRVDVAAGEMPFWRSLPPIAPSDGLSIKRSRNAKQRTWYARLFGQVIGPMSLLELVAMAEQGEITIGDPVKPPHEDTWLKAGEIDELSCALFLFHEKAWNTARSTVTADRRDDDVDRSVSNADDQPVEPEHVDRNRSAEPSRHEPPTDVVRRILSTATPARQRASSLVSDHRTDRSRRDPDSGEALGRIQAAKKIPFPCGLEHVVEAIAAARICHDRHRCEPRNRVCRLEPAPNGR